MQKIKCGTVLEINDMKCVVVKIGPNCFDVVNLTTGLDVNGDPFESVGFTVPDLVEQNWKILGSITDFVCWK